MYAGHEIDEGLAPGDGFGLLLSIDKQQVASPHSQVGHDSVGIGEVDATHQVQRFIVVGVESEVLQQKFAANDSHRVVVEAHSDAVGNADKVGGVDVKFSVDIRMCRGAMDGHAALSVAVKTHDLVWHKAVDE